MERPELKRGLFGYSSRSVRALLADRDLMFTRASERAREAKERAADLESELQASRSRLEALEAGAKESESRLTAMRAERDLLRERAARGEVNAARADRLEQELKGYQDRAAGLTEELRAAQRRVMELVTQVNEAQPQMADLRQRATAAEAASETSRHERDSLQERVTALERELEAARAEARTSAEERQPVPQQAPATPPVLISVSDPPSTAEELSGVLRATGNAVGRIVEAARERGEEELRELEQVREYVRADLARLTAWRERLEPALVDLVTSLETARLQVTGVEGKVFEAVRPTAEALESLEQRIAAVSDLSERPAAAGPQEGEDHPQREPGDAAASEEDVEERAWRTWQ